ncbi:serine/threonine-protein kinase [Chondromyces crocatus]|uniref:Protein kinase domain-containing protein n=1 Tax=Chondromyces crocatus TaxID=52 RepID=A0A0K1E718_CHOCO|nr:serine/threonine-protein kinase [Chondromyces crocatus]AKT36492.1 uncharacterized protein CMC5_006080 [Chondromyces crocatus]
MTYDHDAELWVGQTFAGKWHIERVLGVGGMGAVLFGRGADGATVALKVLHTELNAHPEVRKRFLLEGHIGNTLGGPDPIPGVVRVLGSGSTSDGIAYLAMEVLQGENLFDRMVKSTTMPPGEVLTMAEQVLDTLVVAHGRGVVHRDLKPENIHLGADGRVRLLDFGIARVLDGLQGMPEKTATKTGMILGTATYMAPEQATGLVSEIDGRTDLFGLAATMFRLLAGRPVHGDISETLEIIAAATEAPPPLSSVAPTVPADVAAIVDRALAFVKYHRYPDAETMRLDVRAVRSGHPAPYARAVLEGRLHPGQRMVSAAAHHPPVASPLTARAPEPQPDPSQVAAFQPQAAQPPAPPAQHLPPRDAAVPVGASRLGAQPAALPLDTAPRRRPVPAATVLGLGPPSDSASAPRQAARPLASSPVASSPVASSPILAGAAAAGSLAASPVASGFMPPSPTAPDPAPFPVAPPSHRSIGSLEPIATAGSNVASGPLASQGSPIVAPSPLIPTAPGSGAGLVPHAPGSTPRQPPSGPNGAVPSGVRPAATLVEPSRPAYTAPDHPSMPAKTLAERTKPTGGQVALLVGGASLALGILLGLVVIALGAC